MDNPVNGDTQGDIVTRGIVSEERARVMYERYVYFVRGGTSA